MARGDARLGRRTGGHRVGELLADVARADPAALSPVRVPVRAVGAPRAVLPPATDVLLPVGDLPLRGGLSPALARSEQPPHEDEEPAQVELVELPDLAHELPIDRHLR